MIFGNYNEEYKHCILKCKNGVHFFRIPNCPKTRKIWMDNLGLKSINVNSRVCNNHFTDQMFTTSGKRLKRTAIPNKNLPSLNSDVQMDDQISGQLESMIGNLLYKDAEEPSYKVEPDVMPVGQPLVNSSLKKNIEKDDSQNFPHEINTPAVTHEFLGDGSKLLLNYQLRNQGKHVCNVMELPEFILVFTAFRVKDTFIIPPNDLMPEYMQNDDTNVQEIPAVVKSTNTRKTLRIRRNLKKKESPKMEEPIQFEHSAPREIKYVPYTPQKNVVQRERETQADASSQIITADIGVQCNVDEESGAGKDDSSELEWINHIIHAHVFNAEGDMYECHICGEIAASYASKLQHLLVHKESSSLCAQCGRLFTSHMKLKNHEKKEHLEKKFEIKKALRCPKFHCTKAFHSRRQLFDHIDQHTKKTEKRCSKCQRSFSSSIQLHCHKSRRSCWR